MSFDRKSDSKGCHCNTDDKAVRTVWCLQRTGDQVVRTAWCLQRKGVKVLRTVWCFKTNRWRSRSTQFERRADVSSEPVPKSFENGKPLMYVFPCKVTFIFIIKIQNLEINKRVNGTEKKIWWLKWFYRWIWISLRRLYSIRCWCKRLWNKGL